MGLVEEISVQRQEGNSSQATYYGALQQLVPKCKMVSISNELNDITDTARLLAQIDQIGYKYFYQSPGKWLTVQR